MKICKKLWLGYQIRKYGKFLLSRGIAEAYKRDKNLQIGLEERMIVNNDIFQNIYLPRGEFGKIDVSKLLNFGAENYPQEARRYIVYRKMLDRLN